MYRPFNSVSPIISEKKCRKYRESLKITTFNNSFESSAVEYSNMSGYALPPYNAQRDDALFDIKIKYIADMV